MRWKSKSWGAGKNNQCEPTPFLNKILWFEGNFVCVTCRFNLTPKNPQKSSEMSTKLSSVSLTWSCIFSSSLPNKCLSTHQKNPVLVVGFSPPIWKMLCLSNWIISPEIQPTRWIKPLFINVKNVTAPTNQQPKGSRFHSPFQKSNWPRWSLPPRVCHNSYPALPGTPTIHKRLAINWMMNQIFTYANHETIVYFPTWIISWVFMGFQVFMEVNIQSSHGASYKLVV